MDVDETLPKLQGPQGASFGGVGAAARPLKTAQNGPKRF